MRAKPKPALVEPETYPDGACKACLGGNKCDWHIERDAENDRKRSEMLRRVCAGIRANEIGRVCSRYELESDEFMTREQKAEALITW